MWRGPWQEEDTAQGMDLCRHHLQAGNKEREENCAKHSRTRAAKAKAQEEHTAVDREVKRSIKKEKRDYVDDLARQAETAAGQGNLRDLYLVTKKLMGKFQQTEKPVMDKNRNPLTTTKEQLKRWAEHFRELLYRPTPDSPPDISSAETELPISCDKPSKAEIKKAIMTLRSGKAAGPDETPAEAIKSDLETAVNMLYSLFSKIREKEEVPAQWKEGIIIKLPKMKTLGTAASIKGSCSSQHQARFSTGFYWRGWRRLLTPSSSGPPFRTWAEELPTPASCLKVLRWRLEFVRGARFHRSSSSWSSTGSWRPLQQVGTTVYRGHSGRSETTLTSLMTWCSWHTITARCRTRPLSWRPHQQGQGSRSTGRRPSWWRWTQLPTHQSRLVESPSRRWSLSSTWKAWLTNR